MFVARDSCPVCSGNRTEIVYSTPYVGTEVETFLRQKYDRKPRDQTYAERLEGFDFTVLRCVACSALFQRLAPDREFASEYYETWIADHGHPKFPFGEYTHSINEAMTLTAFLLKQTGKSFPNDLWILDFGVGQGVFALAMRACGCRVAAFDLSQARNDTARDNGLTIVEYEDIPDSNFDFINTEQVFEHLDQPRVTASHLVEGLAPRGVLKISVPYAKWLETGHFRIDWNALRYGRHSMMPLQPLEHLTYFKRPSLDIMMKGLGLSRKKPKLSDELNYLFDWRGLRNIAKNLIRPIARDRFRNYFLYARD